ncbi:hypothetical protein CANINC_001830 [Pichia inconspicua]|uniref:UNC-45/Cro1/She4 central domain-containing protein n=1 Tax=Pichia inconspicua TaxID=52247 RepID=A0A4T0X2N4_9ASCO|nr:hypothetical protein CANINC_001830 [[Candida] inconspicua]
MSSAVLANNIQQLKDDLKTVKNLSLSEKSNHLLSNSKPLLNTLIHTLSNYDENNVDASYTNALTEYLIQYLTFDEEIAVKALLCLYSMQKKSNNLNQILIDKIDDLLQLQDSNHDKYNIIKIVSHLFTFNPSIASQIFTQNAQFFNIITNETTLLSNQLTTLNNESIKQLNIILDLFSNACVDEPSKSMIASMYINTLLNTLSLNDSTIYDQSKSYAVVIIVKIWRMIKPDVLNANVPLLCLKNLFQITLKCLQRNYPASIEALSLLSTNMQIRQLLRNEELIKLLLKLINDTNSTKFGILSILSSIITPQRIQKLLTKSSLTIKDPNSINYFDINTNEKFDPKSIDDDLDSIKSCCNLLYKNEFISNYIVPFFKSNNPSQKLIGECIYLMYYLLFPDIDHKTNYLDGKRIKESALMVKLIVGYLLGSSQNIKYTHKSFIQFDDPTKEFTEEQLQYRSVAIKALSSPFISENASSLYSQDLEKAAIPFILEMIVQHDIDIGIISETKITPFGKLKKQIFNNFDVYYGYVNLAALASTFKDKTQNIICTLGLDSITNTLRETDEMLQNGALQVLNEISDYPLFSK